MCNLSCEDLNSIATLQYYNCLKLVKSEYNSINNMSTIQENVINIQELILKFANLAKRTASEIKLLAVSKTKPVENIIDAYNAGQRHFGESYAKEAEIKIPELKEKGYKKVSLSVQKENYAFKFYESLGFKVIQENIDDCIMVCEL